MSIAELLKPRWKVISSFPGGEWLKIGEILVLRNFINNSCISINSNNISSTCSNKQL